MAKKKVMGYIAVSDEDKSMHVREAFKGDVIDKQITFPRGLGAEHPFDFEALEKGFKKIGLVNGTVNKIKNSIVGDFVVKVDNPNAQALLESFINDTNFSSVLREWIKEGIVKGNGFIEIDLEGNQIRVLNANDMYVKRNKKGKVIEYNQWVGDMKRFSRDSKNLTNFKPNEIAHLKVNKISNDPYGIGLVWPNERVIENIVLNEEDLHQLIHRKAGAPIHVKVGKEGESVQAGDIDDFSNKLKFMHNRTEWVTDGNVEMNTIDFSDIGKNLTDTIDHDMEMLAAGMEIPTVLLGKANIPEGLAKVQLEAWQRKIKAIQQEIETIIEEQIFDPLLNANGFDESVDFVWNLPGETEINNRIDRISKLLANPSLSENMKRMIQLEIARLLNFEDAENFLMQPEKGADEAEKEEQENAERKEEETEIEQPEVPGAKPNANAKLKTMKGCGCGQQLKESQSAQMTIREFVNLQELQGFNYSDYLVRILRKLRIDKFEDLLAKDAVDLELGLLPQKEINKLRIILKDGFRQNMTIAQIEKDIGDGIVLKDRLNDSRKVVREASKRPNSIARTETVRLASLGLLDTYEENNIPTVRFLAALSIRTCPICEGLNGRVFSINEAQGMIPVHTACRCSWIPVTG